MRTTTLVALSLLLASGTAFGQQYETGDTVTYTYQFDVGPVREERVTMDSHDAMLGNDKIKGEAGKALL